MLVAPCIFLFHWQSFMVLILLLYNILQFTLCWMSTLSALLQYVYSSVPYIVNNSDSLNSLPTINYSSADVTIKKSIKWFIKDQAFSLSYDLAPPPSPRPLPSVSSTSYTHAGRLRKRDNLLTREGGRGMGEEPNHLTRSSINHSILSAAIAHGTRIEKTTMFLSLLELTPPFPSPPAADTVIIAVFLPFLIRLSLFSLCVTGRGCAYSICPGGKGCSQ